MKWEYDTDEDIAALATPYGRSAIAVIRTAGAGCIEKAARCFSRPKALLSAKGGTFLYGKIINPQTGAAADEVIVCVSRAPRSYTGGDTVEINCHGSLPGIEAVLAALKAAGFRDAAPGEFTMRAFVAGKLDLTQAEAVASLIDSKTQKGHLSSLYALAGNISEQLAEIRTLLIRASAAVEVQLDYAEDDLDDKVEVPIDDLREASRRLRTLLDSYKMSRILREGTRIALAGRTNSGKSSLFNRLLKENRSIVSDVHGTTRDYLEETVSIDGIPAVLYDTAGLRSTADAIESEGIERTQKVLDACDLVLYVLNAAEGETEEDRRQTAQLSVPFVKVWNKSDLKPSAVADAAAVSALTGEGIGELIAVIADRLRRNAAATEGEAPFAVTERQRRLLEKALAAVNAALNDSCGTVLDGIALELKEALDALGELTGESASADILDAVFSRFCVGK